MNNFTADDDRVNTFHWALAALATLALAMVAVRLTRYDLNARCRCLSIYARECSVGLIHYVVEEHSTAYYNYYLSCPNVFSSRLTIRFIY